MFTPVEANSAFTEVRAWRPGPSGELAEAELCWQVGEATVSQWHEPGEGFAGRKPIDWDE